VSDCHLTTSEAAAWLSCRLGRPVPRRAVQDAARRGRYGPVLRVGRQLYIPFAALEESVYIVNGKDAP